MISLRQINKQIVKAIQLPFDDIRPIKGYDMVPELYSNIFLCAKKKSGKTSACFKIMKGCTDKNTIIYVFCSTIYKDKNWIEIRKHFKSKGIEMNCFTSIYEDGEDQLQKLIDQLSAEAKEQEEDQEESEDEEVDTFKHGGGFIRFNDDDEDDKNTDNDKKKKKARKSKFQVCDYMIIFDDLSGELKSKSIVELLKKNRHYRTKIILSSQYMNDLKPECRKQIDLFLIFKGFNSKKLEEIHRDCDSNVPLETFIEVYKQATEKLYSFLFIDTREDKLRMNFDREFIIA